MQVIVFTPNHAISFNYVNFSAKIWIIDIQLIRRQRKLRRWKKSWLETANFWCRGTIAKRHFIRNTHYSNKILLLLQVVLSQVVLALSNRPFHGKVSISSHHNCTLSSGNLSMQNPIRDKYKLEQQCACVRARQFLTASEKPTWQIYCFVFSLFSHTLYRIRGPN